MSAGIAANKPTAVATKASDIPGATELKVNCAVVDKPWNALIIPITVPNKPM